MKAVSDFRLAWRNLLRNRRRSAITIVAVGLNTAVLIVALGLIGGFQRLLVHNATRLVVGDAQLHAVGYLRSHRFHDAIPSPERIVEAASAQGIQAVARAYGDGLIAAGTKSAGASLWGVEPRAERAAFALPGEVMAGRFLGDAPAREVVIGRKLARSLDLDVGGELVAVVQAADGSLGTEVFRVAGILKTVSEEVDRGAVLIHRADFEALFVSGGRVHELAFSLGDRPAAALGAALGPLPPGLELKTWGELLPVVFNLVQVFEALSLVFMFIFFAAACLGVLNTMLMATHDRVREFGTMKALGATAWRIVGDIAAEAFLLGLVATVVGGALGVSVAWYTQVHGLDLSVFGDASFSFGGIAFDALLRGEVVASSVALAIGAMWLVCVFASLYPAVKAARLSPVTAMTHV